MTLRTRRGGSITTITTTRVTSSDDHSGRVRDINRGPWDAGDPVASYDEAALSAYLNRADTLFIVCHETTATGDVFLGMASGRFELKPYGRQAGLYVDEIDDGQEQAL